METRSEVIILEPTNSSLKLSCDADFSGNWKSDTAHIYRTTATYRTDYVINYAGCLITWASNMQTETALSTTEANFITLSEDSGEYMASKTNCILVAKANGILGNETQQ